MPAGLLNNGENVHIILKLSHKKEERMHAFTKKVENACAYK